MRDTNRIPVLIELVMRIWSKNPDLRLTQLILNIAGKDEDLYYLEDDKLVERLKKTYNE